MKILDTQTGRIHEYGTNCHDSLYVSLDGRHLTYYNLQNGDGSGVGDYRFVCDDGKVPAESQTADALHAEVYFNIGGWNNKITGEWVEDIYHNTICNVCGGVRRDNRFDHIFFCNRCGAKMQKGGAE